MNKLLRTALYASGLIVAFSSLGQATTLGDYTKKFEKRQQEKIEQHAMQYESWIVDTYDRAEFWIGGVQRPREAELTNPLGGPYRNPATEQLNWSSGTPLETFGLISNAYPGIEVRYCENVLLVYLAEDTPKGIGPENHRLVHGALARFATKGQTVRRIKNPATGWLENGVVQQSFGNSPSIPDCMTQNPLPSGRAAIIGTVRDPFLAAFERTTTDKRVESCPAGQHSFHHDGVTGLIYKRKGEQRYNAVRRPVGDPEWGNWELSSSFCKDDYSREVSFSTPCTFVHKGETKSGTNFWKHTKTVTANGVTFSAPVISGSTCWDISSGSTTARLPDPEVNDENTTETTTSGCGSGYNGSITLSRNKLVRTTTFPWNQDPVVATSYSGWSQIANNCTPALACYEFEHSSGRDNDYKYTRTMPNQGQRAHGGWRVSTSPCGGGSSSGGGGDHDGAETDHDQDGRSRQDGDTNDHEGPSNGDAAGGGDTSNDP